MPKEIRAILFTTEEVRGVIEQFLCRGSSARKAPRVERVEVEMVKEELQGRAHIRRGDETEVTMLGPQDLMTAVLMYCGSLRIPLSSRAAKQLELSGTGLMLTMSLNQEAAAPRVSGNAIGYTAKLPTALEQTVAKVRE